MTEARRVAFVHDSNEYGGMERHILMIMRHLDRNRYAPFLLVPGYQRREWTSPSLFVQEAAALDVPVIRPPNPGQRWLLSYARDIWNIRQRFNQHAIDIVHIHTNLPTRVRKGTIGAWASRARAVVRSEHLPPTHYGKGWLTPWMIKPTDWMTDAHLVGSQACLDEQITKMKRDPRKLHCLVYGIELSRFSPDHDVREAKLRLGLNPDLPVICAIGRLKELKGHRFLIDAFKQVLAAQGSAQLLIVGDGELREELTAQIHALGLDAHVRLAGYQADTVPFMQATDIAVMPSSIDEGISLAMLEFMAMGKSMIATNDPSFEETVIHEQSGLIVPKASVEPLAREMLRLLNDPELGRRLAKRGLTVVHEQFNIKRQVNQIMGLYDYLIARPAGTYRVKQTAL